MQNAYFNCSSGEGAVVLVRALSPREGLSEMRSHRGEGRKDGGSKLKDHQLCNGPSKLCIALQIDRAGFNEVSLMQNHHLWLEKGEELQDDQIATSQRIGLHSADQEWREKPWRFYLRHDRSVSIRDRIEELTWKYNGMMCTGG